MDFHPSGAQFVDPSHECGMRYAEIFGQLLARDNDHHVLHESVEKFVEFPVHGLFGINAQVNVHGRGGMRERAYRNVIHTGFGKVPDRFQCDSAGRFQWNAAGCDLNCLPRLFRIEVVEKNDVRAGAERGPQLIQIAYFDLDLHQMTHMPPGFLDGPLEGRMKCKMVVLDENAVEESHPMIHPAAASHRVLVERAQAGNGFASIDNSSWSALNAIHVLAG